MATKLKTSEIKCIQEAADARINRLKNIKSLRDLDALSESKSSIFPPGKKLTTAQKNEAYRVYAERMLTSYYDTDKNGKVTVEEFKNVEAALLKQERDLTLKAFGLAREDKEQDKREQDSALQLAHMFDTNKNGYIDIKEMAELYKKADKRNGKNGSQDGIIEDDAVQMVKMKMTTNGKSLALNVNG